MSKLITLAFIGDVALSIGVKQELGWRSSVSFWNQALPILQQADAVFANLDGTISPSGDFEMRPCLQEIHADRGCVQAPLRRSIASPATQLLEIANIQYVSLANPHILQDGSQSLLDTLYALDAAQIRHAGAGASLQEAAHPIAFTVAGVKLGVIACTDDPTLAASPHQPGTHYLPPIMSPDVIDRLQTAIQTLHRAGVQFVILSMHWGPGMVIAPDRQLRNFAHAAIDCGVDIFYGHGAHLFQAIESYNHGIILYNTGDILNDAAIDPRLRNDWSFIFLIDLDCQGLYRLRLIPVHLQYAAVDSTRGETFQAICHRMQSLCAEFLTPMVKIPEGLAVKLHNGIRTWAKGA